jgi:pimeloyl-ACP methyl ester carboxylesterase
VGVDEHTIEVAGEPVFYRRAPTDGATALFLHSVPTSADDWSEALAVIGGVAVDLPGFGRSGKGGQLDYSVSGYVDFLERFLDALAIERVVIVGHGWGAAFGLLLALRRPDRVSGLALIDAVPLLEGFDWPAGSASPDAWPDARVAAVWEQFDQGTQRAILRLHRSVNVADLELLGRDLGQLRQPALFLWGESDPWLKPAFADVYGARLAQATVQHVAGAGHWPWLDQPEVLQRLAAFVHRP